MTAVRQSVAVSLLMGKSASEYSEWAERLGLGEALLSNLGISCGHIYGRVPDHAFSIFFDDLIDQSLSYLPTVFEGLFER